MPLVKSFPSWPVAVVEALAAKRKETPHGCGSCIHAAWMSPVDNSPGTKAPIEFALGACRADIQLERGRSGLRATTFCTAWNSVLDDTRVTGSDTNSINTNKVLRPSAQSASSPDFQRDPSLARTLR